MIANPSFTLSAGEVDASEITSALLADTLQEADAIEGVVATGYHAIEFLLGAGPERTGRAPTPAVDRLRPGRGLHRRQLRPAGGLPEGGNRPLGLRPRVDGRAVGRRRRGRKAVTDDRAPGWWRS